MTAPSFTDPDRRPTEPAIRAAVGRAAGAWQMLFEQLRAEHPDLGESWRYYADGKSWLLKVARRSTTVFWLSVHHGAFRVAFYFPERLVAALLASDLSEERKADLRGSAPHGKLRRVSVTLGPRRGVRDVMTLIALKKRLR
jgi:hypothetical protein